MSDGLTATFARIRDFVNDRDHDVVLDLNQDFAYALDQALWISDVCRFSRATDCDRVRGLNFNRALAAARGRAITVNHKFGGLDLDLDRALVIALVENLEKQLGFYRATVVADVLVAAVAAGQLAGVAPPSAPPVTRSAMRVVDVVLRILPVWDRVRYAEEFLTDLGNLPGRRQQLCYALRLASRAYSLRRALIDPVSSPRIVSERGPTMPAAVPVPPPEQDPTTVVALIYRIVDKPRRAVALLLVVLPVLATITQSLAPAVTLFGISMAVLCWSATGCVGGTWLLRTGLRRMRSRFRQTD